MMSIYQQWSEEGNSTTTNKVMSGQNIFRQKMNRGFPVKYEPTEGLLCHTADSFNQGQQINM